MQPEMLLLAERLVAAVEGISGNIDRISVSLSDISTNISFLVAQNRRTERSEMPFVSNIEHTRIVATSTIFRQHPQHPLHPQHPTSPSATSSGEHPIYVGSADAPSFEDEDEHFATGEEAEREDERSLALESTSSDNRPVFMESMETQVQNTDTITNRFYTSSNPPSFLQVTIKQEPVDEQEDFETSSRKQFNKSAMVAEEVVLEEARKLQTFSEATNSSCTISTPGCSRNYEELPFFKNTLSKGSDQSLEDGSTSEISSKLERISKEIDIELLGIASCSTSERFEAQGDIETALVGSARELMETESDKDLGKEKGRVQEGEGSHRREGLSVSLQKTTAKQNEMMNKNKKFCPCMICGKCFRDNYALERHTRVHTGERPFKCIVCGKSFTVKDKLDVHMRVHTGVRPFTCFVCNKTFTMRGDLNVHMRIHTNERPFGCFLCGKTFKWSSALNKHMRQHTAEGPFN